MVLLALAFSMVGCVAQGKYDQMRTAYRKSQEQIVDLESQLEEARSRIDALKQAQGDSAEAQKQLEKLRQQRDKLREALAQAKERLRQAQQGPEDIPQQLDTALRELAQQNDELTYQPDQGMVKFESDITFDLGSAEVDDSARQTIQQLAGVLTSNAASDYGIRIVGHTDDVPIESPSTLEKHPTNWHLSVHRAIAIEKILEDSGVTPQRMGVAGYGPYQPIVENDPQQGARENRRVELYLVEHSIGATSRSGGQGSPQARTKSGGGGGSDSESENAAMYK